MKIRNILTSAALALPFAMGAVPAHPGIFTFVNPDGTKLELRQHGDERFHFWTDADNSVVMELNGNGTWVKAMRNGRIMTTDRADLNLLRSEVVPMDHDTFGMAALDNQGRTTYPTIGDDIHSLVVLIQFQDVKFTVPDVRNAIDRMLNEEGYSEYDAVGSARDYFKAASNGKFTPRFDVSEVVTVSNNSAYYGQHGTYGPYNYDHNDHNWTKALAEALKKLDADGMDFSKYDYDNDGVIDNIFFFYAGYGEADAHLSGEEKVNLIWPHQGDYTSSKYVHPDWENLVLDGKTFATYACGNELPGQIPPGEQYPYLTGIGTFCHEYGHVLGLPDLYDTDYSGCKTPGKYDIMDQGSYNGGYQNAQMTQPPVYSAYEKWVCKWVDFDFMQDGTSVTLPTNSFNDVSNIAGLRMARPIGTSYWPEYYFFETRTNDNWDSTFPQEGLVIWHVNYSRSVWTGNNVNSGNRPNVEIIGYDERAGLMTWGLPGMNEFTYPEASNAINPYNTARDEIFLTNLKFDAEKKESTLSYNVVTEKPEDATVMLKPYRPDISGRYVDVFWERVPGATAYLLTVYRVDSNGNTKYISSLNETNVGDVNTYRITNISKAAFDMELHAYVRVVKGIPSAKTSNIVDFVPSALEEYDPENGNPYGDDSAVGEIEGEAFAAYGLQGRIEAPEGASVYNMSGMLTGTENLPAGVYIVRFNGNSVKVYVK